jgi:hypothetical protein
LDSIRFAQSSPRSPRGLRSASSSWDSSAFLSSSSSSLSTTSSSVPADPFPSGILSSHVSPPALGFHWVCAIR